MDTVDRNTAQAFEMNINSSGDTALKKMWMCVTGFTHEYRFSDISATWFFCCRFIVINVYILWVLNISIPTIFRRLSQLLYHNTLACCDWVVVSLIYIPISHGVAGSLEAGNFQLLTSS